MEKNQNSNLLPFERVKREVLVKRMDVATSNEHGCRPEERKTEELVNYGIINLDKPAGPTSHQVTSYARDILKVKKAGHSGTLDPNVTGVLPIAIGRATRIVQLLLTAGKEYVCLMHLHKNVDEKKLREVCSEFTGKIKQLPPVRSSVKRQLRERTVYYFELLEINGKDVLFKVGTQAGTYIRKLVSDIGTKVGGAHMVELRRTKAGPFSEGDGTLATLHDLADAWHYYKNEGNDKYIRHIIQPVERAVLHLPKIWITDSSVESICHGAPLHMPGVAKLESGIEKGDTVAIMTLKDEIVAYGKAAENSQKILKDEKGLAAKPEAVFMKEGTYPRLYHSIVTVIFDMDDLMINSHPAHIQTMEAVLRAIDPSVAFYSGPNTVSLKEEADFFGLKIAEILEKLAAKYGISVPVADLNSQYNRLLLTDFGKFVKPMDGLGDLINGLKEAGYRLALASSALREKIDVVLEKLGYKQTFEAIVSGEDEIKKGKPAPDIFLKAAEKLGVRPSQCVVLEDAKNGVEAAKAAGMYCIGVHNQHAYQRLGIRQNLSRADMQVSSLTEISPKTILNLAAQV